MSVHLLLTDAVNEDISVNLTITDAVIVDIQ